MTKPVLIAWGARRLTPCLRHLATLPSWLRVLEVRGHTEHELAAALLTELKDVDPDAPVMIAPDDLVVGTQAVESILEHYTFEAGVYCGWSNVDLMHATTNVMLKAPHKPVPHTAADYDLLPVSDLATRTESFRVGFNGFTLLTMPAAMWMDEATRLVPCGPAPGYASDWSLCYRLGLAGVPIVCEPAAFAAHLKVDYTRADSQDAWKRLDLQHKSVEWIQ
jgi:hypothetical protein